MIYLRLFSDIAIFLYVLSYHEFESEARRRANEIRREFDEMRIRDELRRAAASQSSREDQIRRPAPAQNGSRIWRFSSFPAWSRGRSARKSIERGRL
jgi:hypothetical protein